MLNYMPKERFYEKMILIIDNSQRKLRNELRNAYLSHKIPCALSDLDHAADYMPCTVIQVTEKYLYDDAKFLASMYNNIPVLVEDSVMDITVPENPHLKCFIGGVTFCSRKIFLTKTEELIVHMLMMTDIWVSSSEIANYCMKVPRKSSVAVHICNINAKAQKSTGFELIDCRRFSGYRLKRF